MVRDEFLRGAVRTAVLIIVLSALTATAWDTASQDTVRIGLGDSIQHGTVDQDGDGLFEYLTIIVELKVYQPGSYGLHGEMDQGITANAGPMELGIGSHSLELEFSGGQISRLSSPAGFEFFVEAYSRDPDTPSVERSYSLNTDLQNSDFEAPSGGTGTEVSIIGSEVSLTGPIMEVRINKSSPMLSISYSGEAGKGTAASVRYLKLVAYNDLDDDGRWDPAVDEPRYSSELDDVDWELGTDFSSGYDITLYGIIQLKLSGTSTVAAWAKLTFRISSQYMDMEGPSQKFDIDIDLWQPLDAERIAIEHRFSDDTGEYNMVEGEETGEGIQSITVMSGSDRAYGTYSWTDAILIGRTEPETEASAGSWFVTEGSTTTVWFSYPLGEDIQVIHHDPTLSMDPDVPAVEKEEDFLVNRPILMMGGLLIGLVIVAGTIFMGKRSKRGSGNDPRGRW